MTEKKSTYFPGYNTLSQTREGSKLSKLKHAYREDGLVPAIKKAFTYTLCGANYAMFNRSFSVDGARYNYFFNIYNSVVSERVVEIPFTYEFVLKNSGRRILEVGNVLSHYFPVSHEVVDKYEVGPHIFNVDIVDFDTESRYDLIVSISTMEHVGFDEPQKEGGKAKRAILKVLSLLSTNGIAVITVPLGYNPEIDSIIANGDVVFSKRYFLKRVSILNIWEETTMEDAMRFKYGQKYPAANSVAMLVARPRKMAGPIGA